MLYHLKPSGRAGIVLANGSMSSGQNGEGDLRRAMVEGDVVEVMIALPGQLFFNTQIPACLWFLTKQKNTRKGEVLFIDARHIYRQVDRAHRDWTPSQIGFIANLVRLYRGEATDLTVGGGETEAKLKEVFGKKPAYADVPGLCKAATLTEIEAQGWSLNPGRYVGVAPGEAVSDEDFKAQLLSLNEELETLNSQARALEQTIVTNVAGILEG
jgi:type I restriction enzyme M protein